MSEVTLYMRNCPPPQDHRRSLDIFLLHGLRREQFFMSEVPLCAPCFVTTSTPEPEFRYPKAYRGTSPIRKRSPP